MTDGDLKEKLCLMLDDELSPGESLKLLDHIERNSDARKQWRRYCLISEAMKTGRVVVPDAGFVDRVSSVLRNELVILAPRAARRRIPEKMVTGALAASLALLAVFVGHSVSEYTPSRGGDRFALAKVTAPSARSSVDAEFRDFLVTHHETAYLAGAQGMLPSVRLVSSDLGR